MRERSKRRKLVSAAMILCILAAMLSGCGKSDRESYASAEEAKQAMNQCRTFVVEGDLEDVNQEGDILADGKRAGRLKETGILNTKWTVSVDGKTWFWIKFVTDEPINNIDGVIAGTTYGYYDENGNKLLRDSSDTTVYSYDTFGMLKNMSCPAVLAEQCFITNPSDVESFGTEEGCQRAAQAYYKAICNYLEHAK